MLNSGIPLHRVLEFYSDSDDTDLARVVGDLAYKVQTGHTFSRAMRNYPTVFSPVFIGLAETGEQSGRINEAFDRLAELLEKQTAMQKKLVAATTYPAILLTVSLAAIAGFVYFVLPMMLPLFQSLEVELPLPTKILLMSRYFVPIGFTVLVGFLVGSWLGKPWIRRYFLQNPHVKMALHSVPLRLPVIGNLTRKIVTVRILRSMATMLDAGLAMVPTLRRCGIVAGNAVIEYRLGQATVEIMDGSTVAEAMQKYDVFPEGAIQMLNVGEESADLIAMISHVAEFYDSEVELAITDMANLLEPLIMVVMGFIVGFIVLSAILPTVQLLQTL